MSFYGEMVGYTFKGYVTCTLGCSCEGDVHRYGYNIMYK